MLGICNSCAQLQSSDVREDVVCLAFFKEFVSFLQLVALYSYGPDSEQEVLCWVIYTTYAVGGTCEQMRASGDHFIFLVSPQSLFM